MKLAKNPTGTEADTTTAHRYRPTDLEEVVPQLPLLLAFVLDALLCELNLVLEFRTVIKHNAVRDLLVHHILEERWHFSDDRSREAAEGDRHGGDGDVGAERRLAAGGVMREKDRGLLGWRRSWSPN